MTHFAEWLSHIQALEVELHQPTTRCDPKRVAALLHEDFEEIGRSGLRYDKRQTVAALEMETDYPQIFAEGFKLAQISDSAVLLTYKSFQRDAQGHAVQKAGGFLLLIGGDAPLKSCPVIIIGAENDRAHHHGRAL